MADTAPSLAPIDAATLASLTLDQIASVKADFGRNGYTKEQVDVAFGGTPAPAASAPINLQAILPSPTVNASQSQEMAAELLKFTPPEKRAEVEAQLKALGYEAPTAPADDRSNTERAMDEAFLQPDPAAYNFNLRGFDQTPDEIVEIDATLRQSFSAAQIPVEMATSLADDMSRAADNYTAFQGSQENFASWAADMREAARRAVDMDEATFIANARRGFESFPPDFRHQMAVTGAIESANVLAQLARHGERLAHRASLEAARKAKR